MSSIRPYLSAREDEVKFAKEGLRVALKAVRKMYVSSLLLRVLLLALMLGSEAYQRTLTASYSHIVCPNRWISINAGEFSRQSKRISPKMLPSRSNPAFTAVNCSSLVMLSSTRSDPHSASPVYIIAKILRWREKKSVHGL